MPNQSQSGKTVLVVDDNVMSRAVIERRVIRDGFEVVSASSGQEALDAVAAGPIDLIFLDMVMPGMGGMEVLEKLRANPEHRDIPVIVISGLDDPDAPINSLAAGARDFLAKPVMAVTLSQILDDYLGREQLTGPDSKPVTAPSESSVEDSPVIDLAFINQLLADYGAESTANFMARFEELASEQHQAITAATESSDLKALSLTAHTLKGGARTLGLARLAAVCRDLERASGSGDVAKISQLTQTLDAHLSDALSSLQANKPGS